MFCLSKQPFSYSTTLLLIEYCAVPENMHTPPQKGLEFPGIGEGGGGGVGGFCEIKTFKV